jgi:soluble lytic murein transglycosylase-like protein
MAGRSQSPFARKLKAGISSLAATSAMLLRRHVWGRTRGRAKRVAIAFGVLAALVTGGINGAVNWLGNGGVFLLDPRSLADKARALAFYSKHRPVCFILGEPEVRREAQLAARRHGVDPAVFVAMIETESAFIPHRISWRGAMGPAQLMPRTAEELGVFDPFSPRQALDGGARYLRQQQDRFKDIRLAVAAYNAGPGNVHGAVPRNGETEHYVARVMARSRALAATRKR